MEKKLIKRIQETRDSEAFELLLKKYDRLLHSIIITFKDSAGDYLMSKDDLYQEACISLFDACMTFREDGGARFSSYAYVVIKRRLGRVVHNMYRTYKEENTSYDKYDDIDRVGIFTTSCVCEDPVLYSEQKSREELMDRLISNLGDLDRKIIEARLNGKTYKQIAGMLDIPVKKVDNRLMVIKRKKEKLMGS